MVVLGQWPYMHSITLYMLNKISKQHLFYYVDEDNLISKARADKLTQQDHICDTEFWIVSSSKIHKEFIEPYMSQIIPPEIPPHLHKLIQSNLNPKYEILQDEVKSKSPMCIVSENSKDLMEEIGCLWNNDLGVWLCDSEKIRNLKQIKINSSNDRIQYDITIDHMIKIYGNVTPHLSLLKSLKAKFNEKEKAYYIPFDYYDKISHIFV